MEGPSAGDVGGHPSGRDDHHCSIAIDPSPSTVRCLMLTPTFSWRPGPTMRLLKTPRATIYSRLVEGRHPRWRDVFPKRTYVVAMDMTALPLFFAALRQAFGG